MRKLLFGVAINDADYTVRVKETVGYVGGKQIQKTVWMCPFYAAWCDMLRRCYSESLKSDYPTYRNASVCEEWLRLSAFKAWMEVQEWECLQLDKDLLFPGNKLIQPGDVCLCQSSSEYVHDRAADDKKQSSNWCPAIQGFEPLSGALQKPGKRICSPRYV